MCRSKLHDSARQTNAANAADRARGRHDRGRTDRPTCCRSALTRACTRAQARVMYVLPSSGRWGYIEIRRENRAGRRATDQSEISPVLRAFGSRAQASRNERSADGVSPMQRFLPRLGLLRAAEPRNRATQKEICLVNSGVGVNWMGYWVNQRGSTAANAGGVERSPTVIDRQNPHHAIVGGSTGNGTVSILQAVSWLPGPQETLRRHGRHARSCPKLRSLHSAAVRASGTG